MKRAWSFVSHGKAKTVEIHRQLHGKTLKSKGDGNFFKHTRTPGLRVKCADGEHGKCFASTCTCPCHDGKMAAFGK